MANITTNLGAVTAYADAVKHGYTGTREQFGEDQAQFAENAAAVAAAVENAEEQSANAQSAATTAVNKANEASGYADNASASATDAETAKNYAETAKEEAINAKNDAVSAASEASGYADNAETAKDEAVAAKNNISSIVSAEVTSQVEQMQIKEGQTVIDGTLTVEGAAADAKTVGDKFDFVFDGYKEISDYVEGWQQGYLNPLNGGSSSGTKFCRTGTFNFDKSGFYIIKPLNGYLIRLNQYNGTPGVDTFNKNLFDNIGTYIFLYIDAEKSYRFGIKLASDDNLNYGDVPSNAIEYIRYEYTDTELSASSKAADAKIVGDKFNSINNILITNINSQDWALTNGYIDDTGNLHKQTLHLEVTSEKIYYPKQVTFALEKNGASNSWYELSKWDINGSFIGRETHTVTTNQVSKTWEFDDDVYFIRLSWKTDQNEITSASIIYNTSNGIKNNAQKAEKNNISVDLASSSVINRVLERPCYDHLFVNRTGNNIVIPHESIYHVNISKALGYKVIEANVQKTSDNHYFVNHLASGAFGGYFHAADGVTDISEIQASDVTWAWIEENVRYNSAVPKYRTRPTTLEEFLIGCKQNELIPLMKFIDSDVAEMTRNIMGDNNYIVYEGTRETAGDAVIFRWESYDTLEDIVSFCDSIGKPLIYGSNKFNGTFTKTETQNIINALHERGYLVSVSYEGNDYWRKYSQWGIDICGGTRTTNRIETGNLYNLETIFNTNDFIITNGTITDNVITLQNGGTLACANIDSSNKQIARVDLEIDYDGIITLTGGLGEFRGDISFDSTDGKLIISTAVINGPVNFSLTANGQVIIKDIKYKVSLC